MDPTYTEQAETFRQKIGAFLAEHLPANWSGMGNLSPEARREFTATWRPTLAKNNLLAVAWPEKFGGAGLSMLERTVLAEEFAKAGVPTGNDNDIFSIGMLGHTLIEWGSEEQQQHHSCPHPRRHRRLVPGLQRAELGLRPRLAGHQGRARR